MKTIKVNYGKEIPKNFTGIVDYTDGKKYWYKEGMLHREDGPAVEHKSGHKQWWIEGKLHRENGPAIEWPNGDKRWYLQNQNFSKISLQDYVVLDHYNRNHNLMWYKLLDKDQVFEYPDIPGLIEK